MSKPMRNPSTPTPGALGASAVAPSPRHGHELAPYRAGAGDPGPLSLLRVTTQHGPNPPERMWSALDFVTMYPPNPGTLFDFTRWYGLGEEFHGFLSSCQLEVMAATMEARAGGRADD